MAAPGWHLVQRSLAPAGGVAAISSVKEDLATSLLSFVECDYVLNNFITYFYFACALMTCLLEICGFVKKYLVWNYVPRSHIGKDEATLDCDCKILCIKIRGFYFGRKAQTYNLSVSACWQALGYMNLVRSPCLLWTMKGWRNAPADDLRSKNLIMCWTCIHDGVSELSAVQDEVMHHSRPVRLPLPHHIFLVFLLGVWEHAA